MSRLVLRNIEKSYQGNRILDGITLDVEEGEFIALVGPSGCGKSTLLRILAGLDYADAGSVTLGERDITGLHPADRNVAMVFQSYALYPHLTAGQNIAVPLAMRQLTTAERLPFIGPMLPSHRAKQRQIQAQITNTAQSLRIDHLLDRKPGQMSGGQRQRVALARAMVRKPGVFLMDEPLSNLDANLRVHTRAEIVDLHRKAGVPTIYVTHDQAEALSMANRVAVMMSGKLLQIDAPVEIYNNPAHIEVAQFIGTPKINILSAQVSDNGIVHFAGQPILQNIAMHAGSGLRLGIRPEHLHLSRPSKATDLTGRVARIEFLGSEVIVHVNACQNAPELIVKLDPSKMDDLALGSVVAISFAARDVLLFGDDGFRLRQPASSRPDLVARKKVTDNV